MAAVAGCHRCCAVPVTEPACTCDRGVEDPVEARETLRQARELLEPSAMEASHKRTITSGPPSAPTRDESSRIITNGTRKKIIRPRDPSPDPSQAPVVEEVPLDDLKTEGEGESGAVACWDHVESFGLQGLLDASERADVVAGKVMLSTLATMAMRIKGAHYIHHPP